MKESIDIYDNEFVCGDDIQLLKNNIELINCYDLSLQNYKIVQKRIDMLKEKIKYEKSIKEKYERN